MKTAKHTPGPWAARGTNQLHNQGVIDSEHEGMTVAVAYNFAEDAALIAAAPDLLEALREVLPDLAHYVATHGPGPDRRLDKARDAIRKATGEDA